MALQLTMSDVIEDAHTIQVFKGDNSYALSSFIREVETVQSIIQDQPTLKAYIHQRVVINKIQGAALHVLRTLGPNPSWEAVKQALVSNFGVRESYDELYKRANVAVNNDIVNYFKYLRNICSKINEKFEFDPEKPNEYEPQLVDKFILRIFINNIDVNLASVIINSKSMNIRDAYNVLEESGLIRNNHNTNNSEQFRNISNNNRRFTNTNSQYPNSTGQNNNSHFSQTDTNFQNRNVNSHMNRSSTNSRRNFTNVPSGQYNNNNNDNVPMETEYLHTESQTHPAMASNEDYVNFLTIASPNHYR